MPTLKRSCLSSLLLLGPILLAVAWACRTGIVVALARLVGGVDLALAGLDFELRWACDELLLALDGLEVYAPGDADTPLVNMSAMRIRFRRVASMQLNGTASVDGLALHFVAYDPLFSDTNLKRLVLAMGGDVAAAEGTLQATEPSSTTVLFERLTLKHVTVHTSIGGAALPYVSLLDQVLDVGLLSAGLSIGLLNWLSGLAFRTLASTSIDALGDTLDGGVAALHEAVGRALDIVETLNARTPLRIVPGSRMLAGATVGVRHVLGGLVRGVREVVGGARRGAKEVAAAKPSPRGVLRGVGRGVGGVLDGLGEGAAAVVDGTAAGASALLDGVEESSARLASLGVAGRAADAAAHGVAHGLRGAVQLASDSAQSVVGGVVEGGTAALGGAFGGAASVVGGFTDGAAQVAGGVGEGGASLFGGVAGGLSDAAESAAHGNASGVLHGGGRILGGVLDGGGRALRGIVGGAQSLVTGAASGVEQAAGGAGGLVQGLAQAVVGPVGHVAGVLSRLVPGRGAENTTTT